MQMNQAFLDRYRCPEIYADFRLEGELSPEMGYFRFGADTLCYGQSAAGSPAALATGAFYDVLGEVRLEHGTCSLPVNPTQLVENLRTERYVGTNHADRRALGPTAVVRKAYYLVRPLLPVSVRRHLQRVALRGWDTIPFPGWPVDRTVEQILERLLALSLQVHGLDRIPFIWFWPEGRSGCLILTHDVETSAGVEFCPSLMDLDHSFGLRASYQVIPEKRYPVAPAFLDRIRERGCEVNIHDLNHDGRLFSDREEFLRRAGRINHYAREFGAAGFRSGVLYRNLDWFDALQFSYDMSVPNVAHLDPQRGGCCTVFPYFIGDLLELPLTTTQDYSLFNILGDYSLELWKRQIGLILERHGLVSFNAHPDYLKAEPARRTYTGLLGYLSPLASEGKLWAALPKEVDRWWRQRSRMKLVREGGAWRIEGEGRERARVAYARLEGDHVVYTVDETF